MIRKLLTPFLLFFLLACQPEWNNPLEVDGDLKQQPQILKTEIDAQNQIKLSLSYSYSDKASIILERKAGSAFGMIPFKKETPNVLVDTSFNKEMDQTFAYRFYIEKDGYRTDYSNEAAIQYISKIVNAPASFILKALELQGVKLEWKDNSANESGYEIEKNSGGGFVNIKNLPANSASYLDAIDGVPATPLQLSYRLRARRDSLGSPWVEQSIDYSGIGSPGNLQIVSSSTEQIAIQWQDNSSIEDGYSIERKRNAEAFTEIAQAAANSTSYTDALANEGFYYYRVRAKQGSLFSHFSNEISVNIVYNPLLALSVNLLNFDSTKTTLSCVISNPGTGRLDWSASNPHADWLAINPVQGEVTGSPQTVDFTLNRADMPYGYQEFSVPISSNGGSANITLKSWRVAPKLTVTPDTLNFGNTQSSLYYSLKNDGSESLDWTLSAPVESWFSLHPVGGSLSAGQTTQVIVDVDRAQMDYGTAQAQVDFTSNQKTQARFIKATKSYAQLSFFRNVTGSYTFYKPLDIEFAPANWGIAFAADYGNQTVAVLSPSSYLYADRIVLGNSDSEPTNICVHPSLKKAYVACPNASQIKVIDELSVIDMFDLSGIYLDPYDCTLSDNDTILYAVGRTTSHNGKLAAINTVTGQVFKSLDLEQLYASADGGPHISLVGNNLFITNYDNPARIYVVDKESFVQSTVSGSIPLYPHEIAYHAGDGMLYITCGITGNNLLKVNPQTAAVVANLPMNNVHSLTIAQTGKWKDLAFVTSKSQNKIYSVYLPAFKIVQEIDAGSSFGPTGIAINPAGDEVWVTCYDGNGLKIFK